MTTRTTNLLAAVMLVAAFLFVIVRAMRHDLRIEDELEQLRLDNVRLRDELSRRALEPLPVVVTCECPDYEEGWEDSEFAEGCNPEPISLEEMRTMCSDLEEYGYEPDC
jgi:hypothetical protein